MATYPQQEITFLSIAFKWSFFSDKGLCTMKLLIWYTGPLGNNNNKTPNMCRISYISGFENTIQMIC